jgi:homogentisate 1,2-dioxygenase
MYYRSIGEVPHKRHLRHRGRDGTLLAEEMMGAHGFSGASSLLYHRHSPSAIVAADAVPDGRAAAVPATPVLPQHYVTGKLPSGGDLVRDRHVLFRNDDLVLSYAHALASSPLYRNAVGDELVYLQRGDAVLESVFGALDVLAGDYVVIPASTTHRWSIDAPVEALVLEASGHVTVPTKYLSPEGQFLAHAPYCERDLRAASAPLLEDGVDVDVLVRHRQGCTRYVYAHHPFDVVGWDGHLYPYAFSIHDFEPIVGSLHQPPPVHQTFAGPNFVVCSFVPRPYDFHPDAIKVPYHHANVDSDEVLFYSDGDFMSRAGSGIGVGSISYHPAGFVHGPQPGSVERAAGQDRAEETAVMVDTFRPLNPTEVAAGISDPGYPWTWAR